MRTNLLNCEVPLLPFKVGLSRQELESRTIPKKILTALRTEPTFSELKKITKIPSSTLSYYLKELQTARLIKRNIVKRTYVLMPTVPSKRENVWTDVWDELTLKRMYQMPDGEIKTEARGIRTKLFLQRITPSGRKKPDEESLNAACRDIADICIPLLILASLPKSGWMKLPLRSSIQLRIGLRYSLTTHEDLWELMNAFCGSDCLEDITDTNPLVSSFLYDKIDGQMRNLTALVNPQLSSDSEAGKIILERFAIHRKKYREEITGRSPIGHTCTHCGSFCEGGPLYDA